MQQLAAKRGVPLHLHAVIYQLIEQLKEELSAKLPPLTSESVLGKSSTVAPESLVPSVTCGLLSRGGPGEATVLATFDVSVGKKKVPVAGCRVQKGQLDRRLKFRLIRGRDTVWEGESSLQLLLAQAPPLTPPTSPAGALATLKHHKDDVQTVSVGMECGLAAEGDAHFRPGDVVVCFQEVKMPQVTSWDPGF